MRKIFPVEIMEYTSEYHFNKHSVRSLVIYQTVLILLIVSLVAMFLIRVDVNVKSVGVIRTNEENSTIKAVVSGRVENLNMKENQFVKEGDVLLTIRTDLLDQQYGLFRGQEAELAAQISDLKKLTAMVRQNKWQKKPYLSSSLYQQEYAFFRQRLSQLQNQLTIVAKNYERYQTLYKKKVISVAEYEQANYSYQEAKNELQLLYDEQGASWQNALTTLGMRNDELRSRLRQTNKEKEFYTLRAPISGRILHFSGLQPGSSIAANEVIAQISPDSGLIAEAYVLPRDIGFLKPGTTANFQIEAFDYNQWGMVKGKIVSISSDAYTDKQQPYFKVRCLLADKALKLKNGYVGKLRKGMTLQARFFVTRRTLFQLLYDKADDWLNPNVLSAQETASL